MLCHHTFSLLCPRSRERTSPENQQKQPMTPNEDKCSCWSHGKMTKLKLQKTLLKSLGRSIYILLHFPTKTKTRCLFQTNKKIPPQQQNNPTKPKKDINATLPIHFTSMFCHVNVVHYIYIYISFIIRCNPRYHRSHQVEAFGSNARWLPVNASVEVSGAKLWCRFRARRKNMSTKTNSLGEKWWKLGRVFLGGWKKTTKVGGWSWEVWEVSGIALGPIFSHSKLVSGRWMAFGLSMVVVLVCCFALCLLLADCRLWMSEHWKWGEKICRKGFPPDLPRGNETWKKWGTADGRNPAPPGIYYQLVQDSFHQQYFLKSVTQAVPLFGSLLFPCFSPRSFCFKWLMWGVFSLNLHQGSIHEEAEQNEIRILATRVFICFHPVHLIWIEKQQLGKWLQVLSTFKNPPPRETGRSPKPILQGYFRWKKSGDHQLICSFSHYLQGFIHPRWLAGFLNYQQYDGEKVSLWKH